MSDLATVVTCIWERCRFTETLAKTLGPFSTLTVRWLPTLTTLTFTFALGTFPCEMTYISALVARFTLTLAFTTISATLVELLL